MKTSFRHIALGDTTTDVFLEVPDASVHCHLKHKECLLCVTFGDKIAVEDFVELHAVGNAANNAIGSARLGFETALWTIIGRDISGNATMDVFHDEHVHTAFVERDPTHRTNYSTVLRFQGERSILVYHEHRKYVLPKLPASDWMYLTSMGPGWERMTTKLVSHLQKTGTRFGFNPGTHQMKSGLSVLKPLMKKTFAFIVNVEEAQRILKEPKRDVGLLLRKLASHGPRTVVITDGQAGAHALLRDERLKEDIQWFMPIYPDPKPVVERTGCGDSFSTGFLGALMDLQPTWDEKQDTRSLEAAVATGLQWGAANARMVVQFVGAREGLQTKAQIHHALKTFSRIRPKRVS